jgi:hypothetical protein
MMEGVQCNNCKNFEQDTDNWIPYDTLFKKPVCTAFPKGIPTEIFGGDFGHYEPYNGDNGIRFEPVENTTK